VIAAALAAKAGIIDWLPVIAAGIIAVSALVGIRVDNRSQAKRERERWLDDRRLDAYSALATAVYTLGHTTATRGGIVAGFEPNPVWASIYQHIQDRWEEANDGAAEAQHRALLGVGHGALRTNCRDERPHPRHG
jgi:hypothetical protein